MSRPLYQFNRPADLDEETKKRIEKMFGEWVFINWGREEIVFGSSPIPMSKLGKLMGLLNNKCITVRSRTSPAEKRD